MDHEYNHYNVTLLYPFHTKDILPFNTPDIEWRKKPGILGFYECTTIKNRNEVKSDMIMRMKSLFIPSGNIMFSSQLKYK